MSKNLVIVESPAKAKTIEKFLGSEFKVVSSNGHIADLPSNELGIDLENNYNPKYKVTTDKNKSTLTLELKYHSGNPVISTFERISKPGRRIFSSAEGLPKINNGLGIAIISTPKGVMTDIDARKQRVGGEIICKVF